jgi:general stress protein YciG
MTGKSKKPQGFATFSKEKQYEVSSAGGKEAWRLGKAHKFTPEEAKVAGKKGGRPRKYKEPTRELYGFEGERLTEKDVNFFE